MGRHPGLVWAKVQARLEARPDKLWSLAEMKRTSGEPDVVGQVKKSGEFIFIGCSEQTPAGHGSLCYDDEALASRKEHKPSGSFVGMASAMGIALLTEEVYFALQKLGEFDTKRSSWIKTPADIRKFGGAFLGGSPFRPRFHLSPRRGTLLQRPGFPRFATRFKHDANSTDTHKFNRRNYVDSPPAQKALVVLNSGPILSRLGA